MDQVDHTLKLWRQSVFAYGTSDCLMSVGEHVVRCCGANVLDVPSIFRDTYSDVEGADKHIKERGGMDEILDMFGLEYIYSSEAQRGDIVIINTGEGGECLAGVCTGDGVAARTERGVIEVSRRFLNLTDAWKVPQ